MKKWLSLRNRWLSKPDEVALEEWNIQFVEEKELAKINGYVKEYFEGKDTSNVINEFVFRIFKLTKEEIKYIDSENYLYNQ